MVRIHAGSIRRPVQGPLLTREPKGRSSGGPNVGYSLMVKREFVELLMRVRFSLVTPIGHMSLDKAIKSGKERRNPKRSPSTACRNHGSCEHCLSGRMIRTNKEKAKAEYHDDM